MASSKLSSSKADSGGGKSSGRKSSGDASGGLLAKTCRACEGNVPPLTDAQIQKLMKQVSDWTLENGQIVRTFRFENYYQTMAFVNATAWVSHRENHHPDMEVGYNRCVMRYSTHSVGGLSENDFICAAKINAIWQES